MMLFTFNTVASLFRRSTLRATVPDAVDFGFLADRNEPQTQPRIAEAAYDAAQTVNDNRRHWRWADLLSANAANSHSVRQIIRSRARYEHDNNPVLKGIVTTLANDMVGHGPALQLNSPSEEFNATVRLWWNRWAKAVRLWPKLRQARRAKAVDGESFLLLVYDPTVKHPVKWNIRVIEADRVTTPDMPWEDPRRTDGIVYDEYGNPIEYHILRTHPGDTGVNAGSWEYDRVPATYVFHWFDSARPEQLRGVSELSPSLGTIADLRRFTKATAKKRDIQASITGFIEQAAGNFEPGSNQDGIAPFSEFDIEPGMFMALPPGNKGILHNAAEASEPYSGFKREQVSDVARPWGMSYNVAACNSGDSSFSSGKLDQRLYGRHMELEQDTATAEMVDPIFGFWMFAARHGVISIVPDDSAFDWEQSWSWPTLDDPDPNKTSQADASDIDAGIVSIRTVQMRRKQDPDQEEKRIAEELGMTVPEYRAALRAKRFAGVQPTAKPASAGPKQPTPTPAEMAS